MAGAESQSTGPMAVFRGAEASYRALIATSDVAEESDEIGKMFAARTSEEEFAYDLLSQIHLAGEREGVDPVEYFSAVTLVSGRVSEEAVTSNARLATMQRRLSHESTPVVIIGAQETLFAAGMSAGGLAVAQFKRRSELPGLRVDLPLTDFHSYGSSARLDSPSPTSIRYDGNASTRVHLVGVRQREPLRFAGNAKQAEEAIEVGRARKGFSPEYSMIAENTGIAPVVAYGRTAVTSVLKGMATHAHAHPRLKLQGGDVAATALHLGIDPAEVVEKEMVRTSLMMAFEDGVHDLLVSQVAVDAGGNLGAYERPRLELWPAAATKEVVEYLDAVGIVPGVVRSALSRVYAEAASLSDGNVSRSTERVAAAFGSIFDTEIDPEYLKTAAPDLSSPRPIKGPLL